MNPFGALAAAALAAAPSPGVSPPALAPGEETVFELRFLGIPSGEGQLMVGQPSGDVWPIIFQMRTAGVAGFFDIREHLVSYWDAAEGRSRGFDLRAYEVGDFKTERARFDRANGKVTFERVRNGRRTQQRTLDVPKDVQDLTSAVMWLRLRTLAPGEHHEVPVFVGVEQFTLVADVLARERVATPAGTFDTVKVQVRTAVEGRFSSRRDTFAWFSDDARHVLVRMDAEFLVGGLVATVKRYRPGERMARADPP